MSALPVPEPVVDPEARPFWDGTARGELMLQRCAACGTVSWPARRFCPNCSAGEPEWFVAAGTGEIYSFTVVRKAHGDWREAVPYVVAYVQLTEGPRILTNIVDSSPESIHIGQRVRAVFVRTANGYGLCRFVPVSG
ncbi:MAG TPA: Zn-ribbon domain-containing OB-fold protein [Pseudonocardiaceae bacterium]|jgi:hypothetical protein|nr:Zn-ribbon domain-containing OB-fold protein [Pseudonocardiaceae bacterium]